MFNTSSAHEAIAEAVQGMWAATLGVKVKLVNQEFAVFLETTKSLNTPQIYRAAWCPDYPDANNFLREVWASNGANNPVDASGQASRRPDVEERPVRGTHGAGCRRAGSGQAPRDVRRGRGYPGEDDAVVLPLYWYTNLDLTKPYVTRTFSSTSSEAYEKWDMTSP